MQYSVLMSVYIKDQYDNTKRAIESMLNQTKKPEQYVIVIDGAINEDLNILLDEYKRNYPELFTIVKIERNSGLANALNVGLKVCRNDLVARMDADDISLQDRCEKILNKFENDYDMDICGCNLDEFFDSPDDIVSTRKVPSNYDEIKLFMRRRQPFNHPTVIYKKSKVIASGGYPTIKRKEDFDLFSRMLHDGCYANNIDESLYLYHSDKDNYKRRKTLLNLKASIYVYWRHLKRGGCSFLDFIIMCAAEVLFFVLPYPVMKCLSDNLLREKYVCRNN